jgi:hypothetical protein
MVESFDAVGRIESAAVLPPVRESNAVDLTDAVGAALIAVAVRKGQR